MAGARLLAPRQVCARLDISMRELRAMKKAGAAPESYDVTPRTVRYLSTSVDELRRRRLTSKGA